MNPKALARFAVIGTAAILLGGCYTSRVAELDRNFPADYRQRHPVVVGAGGAYVASRCGQWPHDLGAADMVVDQMNRPHWNHGCATQHNLAAMVANPNDLITPRATGEIDATRRATAIGRYRRGEAPGPHTIHQPIQPLTDIKSSVRGGS